MTITAADLKFFASEVMTDAANGGGARGSTVVQDGVLNNAFPDITESDRTTGRARLRKLYPSVIGSTTEPLLGATVLLNDVPADTAVSMSLFKYGNATTLRSEFEAALKLSVAAASTGSSTNAYPPYNTVTSYALACTFDGGGTSVLVGDIVLGNSSLIGVGDVVSVLVGPTASLHKVTARGMSGSYPTLTVVPALPGVGSSINGTLRKVTFAAPLGYATVATTASASGTTVDLATLWARVVPINPSVAYPSIEQATGVGSGWAQYTGGFVEVVRPGDMATLWNEASMSPATVAASDVKSTGRTNLSQLAVVGNNGVEIARFLKNGVVPSGVGCTADLAAGTVTFTDVTGYSQPVTVKHRISETVGIQSISGLTATLLGTLSQTYASGSVLSTEVPLGDLQPAATNRFSQQAWTKVFSDTLIGLPAPVLYSGAIDLTGAGAEQDRYAVIFALSGAFSLTSERLGLIAQGNVSGDFSPLNPTTGEPLFTLYSAGWESPGVGNVFRFNTTASYAPVWVCSSVHPSAPAAGDKAALRFRGGV